MTYTMVPTSLVLKTAIGVLMIDSIIELSFISSMVAWLAARASGTFEVSLPDGTSFALSGLPTRIMVDQGHTSNGAAGTAFVLIGCGGIIALWLRSRSSYHTKSPFGTFSRVWYRVWLGLNIPALLLTLGSLAYVFAVTSAHEWQRIDVNLASGLAAGALYPSESWTPQNWFQAVLKLDLVADRDDIERHYWVMRGWQYNLIPMFLIQLGETALAVYEGMRRRKESSYEIVEKDMGILMNDNRGA